MECALIFDVAGANRQGRTSVPRSTTWRKLMASVAALTGEQHDDEDGRPSRGAWAVSSRMTHVSTVDTGGTNLANDAKTARHLKPR